MNKRGTLTGERNLSTSTTHSANINMNTINILKITKTPLLTFLGLCAAILISTNAAMTPKEGEMAPDFALKTLDEKSVELQGLTEKGTVVLVVLRGWPGYQCPLCQRQVHDLVSNAKELRKTGAQMLFVYPGPADQLKAHAQEFLQNKEWPSDFLFVTDPDYAFTMAYGLRWNATNETAYPSTFIIDRNKKVRFSHVSREHGGRVASKELLIKLDQLK